MDVKAMSSYGYFIDTIVFSTPPTITYPIAVEITTGPQLEVTIEPEIDVAVKISSIQVETAIDQTISVDITQPYIEGDIN